MSGLISLYFFNTVTISYFLNKLNKKCMYLNVVFVHFTLLCNFVMNIDFQHLFFFYTVIYLL